MRVDMESGFERYCRKWSSEVALISDQKQRMEYFTQELPSLLKDNNTVRAVLGCMQKGRRWPDLRRSGLFRHEVLLYLDGSRRFSVRLYFHAPNAHTDTHDHTSWGISGTPFGRLSVIRYRRHGEKVNGQVELRKTDARILLPGEVDVTQPWDEGIHQTGSADNTLNVMISIYGRPGRRLYVNRYDEKTGRVERLYPSKILFRNLARETINFLD